MTRVPSGPPRATKQGVRYPYLVIRLMSAVYTVRPLPQDLSRELCIALGWSTIEALQRRHRVCVVFGPQDAVYLELDGNSNASAVVPSGGVSFDVDVPDLGFLPT